MALLSPQTTNRDAALADQGVAYVAFSPVPGTGQASFATATTLAIGELNPDFFLYNPGPNTVYPLYLRVRVSAVSTSSVKTQFTQFVDVGARGNVTGTSLTITNTNPNSVATSNSLITVGLNVLTAATAKRRFVGHAQYRSTIDVIEDVYHFTWGSPVNAPSAQVVATVSEISKIYMPIAIPPGFCFGITNWAASKSAGATQEYEFGFIEK